MIPLDFGSHDAIEYLEMASLALYAPGMDRLHTVQAIIDEARSLAKHGECVLRETDSDMAELIDAMPDVFDVLPDGMVRLK